VVALAAAVDPVAVLAAWVYWLSTSVAASNFTHVLPPFIMDLAIRWRLGSPAVKNKARSCVRAQELARHFRLSQFVEGLTGAVQRNDVVNV
jgi:hypothetical protein